MVNAAPHKLRIFISSTIADLRDERAAIDDALTQLGVFEVVRAETLAAEALPVERVCLSAVAASDAVVLIVGGRYGFVPQESNAERLSVTHLEIQQAAKAGRPVFAFIQVGIDRDEQTTAFLEEVGHFSRGYFWKEWATISELTLEVSRALVNWLAREARESKSRLRQWRIGAARVLDAGDAAAPIIISVDGAKAEDEAMATRQWKERLVTSLKTELRSRFLPVTVRVVSSGEPSTLRISLQPAADARVRVLVASGLTEGDGEGVDVTTLALKVRETDLGERAAVHLATAAALFAAEDIPRGVLILLDLLRHPDVDREEKTVLLRRAADEAVWDDGDIALVVGRWVTSEHIADAAVLQSLVPALMLAQRRFESSGALAAAEEARRLSAELLTDALESRGLSPDLLYSLVRLNLESPAALPFYDVLLREFPEYEARWYVQRDLGLAHYHAGRFEEAAHAYEKALQLKGPDSELARYAADAFFYRGEWAQALRLYRTAVEVDSTQDYFVADKIQFILAQIRRGVSQANDFDRRREISRRSEILLSYLARLGLPVPNWAYRLVLRVYCLNVEAAMQLALEANREGRYSDAVSHLKVQLIAIPENPKPRLNLVANLLFLAGGVWSDTARDEFRRAVFHGGLRSVQELRTRLSNTASQKELMAEVPTIVELARLDHELNAKRRMDSRQPEWFGATLHYEL